MMQILRLFLPHLLRGLSLPLLLVSCVTINIYFPAAAAEKAADRIIEDVWGKQPVTGKQPGEPPPPQSPKPQEPSAVPEKDSYYLERTQHYTAHGVLNLLISPANAAEADINIATPAISKLRASMKARHATLAPYYNSGVIGLTRDALLAAREINAVPLKSRNTVKQLVADENRDRNALYQEIAKANNHPEWEPDIRKTFAERWVKKASTGWWYQDDSGAWKQK